MTYDWEGTRTRRIRNFKICLTVCVPLFVAGLSALQIGF
jgi:hypothetical protein